LYVDFCQRMRNSYKEKSIFKLYDQWNQTNSKTIRDYGYCILHYYKGVTIHKITILPVSVDSAIQHGTSIKLFGLTP
jgi:D-alanyl-lipoteichoic acid acyltransferase DltB (MBOAT superfamily)